MFVHRTSSQLLSEANARLAPYRTLGGPQHLPRPAARDAPVPTQFSPEPEPDPIDSPETSSDDEPTDESLDDESESSDDDGSGDDRSRCAFLE